MIERFVALVKQGELVSLRQVFSLESMRDVVVPGSFLAKNRTFVNLPLLHYCVLHDKAEIAHFLLERHVDPNKVCREGLTPLHLAVFVGNRDMVDTLLFYRASATVHDTFGRSTLWYAVENRDVEIGECLLLAGALEEDPAVLHLAIATGQLEFVRLLVRYGANPEAKSRSGKTAFEVLKLPQQKDFEDVLRNTKPDRKAPVEIQCPAVKSLSDLIEKLPEASQREGRPTCPVINTSV